MRKRLALSTSLNFDLWDHAPSVYHNVPANQARGTSRFRVVRSSIGIKLGQGPWFFGQGDKLDGVLMAHPVNASRKVIILTELGTFNVNEEDIEEF